MPRSSPIVAFLLAMLVAMPSVAFADDAAQRRPKDFAIVFNMGYGGDNLPKDPASYEKMLVALKEAHFNVVLGQYEPWRVELLKKHGMKLFVDLLVPDHHVYKNVEGAKKLCEGLRGNESIYGYHIWSDNITKGQVVAGRTRDARNVHEWDPTHPVYIGTKTMSGLSGVEGEDIFGYYDFHWKRGGHFAYLGKALARAKARNLPFLRYDDAVSGIVGKGNSNRVGYTFATSVPFGLKGYIYHYTGGIVDSNTWQLDAVGKDLKKVNAKLASVGPQIMEIGAPLAVYSGAITKTAKNDPTGQPPAIPDGLTAVPADHWFQIALGEVLVGEFIDANKRGVLALATHNAYEPQVVKLKFVGDTESAERFDRAERKWVTLKIEDDQASLQVEESAVELVRVNRGAPARK